jgi:hypothetical protein
MDRRSFLTTSSAAAAAGAPVIETAYGRVRGYVVILQEFRHSKTGA